ncbi:unnamed protein product [Rotaria socialis]|nr:unnamed protein product [Rotaria socialis]CAF3364011.1 unnamed protein product [Rotaria socialis]CAF3721239.1 unnamed protein product [Rotaria socialis]CAF4394029.1 unnamed protein product [Rotaria socialis]CAF4475267.1 unnamed protein product [Rotaria socialis]
MQPLSVTTSPVGLFENEPRALIFDPNGSVIDPQTNIRPYERTTSIVRHLADFQALVQMPNRKFPTTAILDHLNQTSAENFLQLHLHPNAVVLFYFLFFPNGENLHKAWTERYGPRLIGCDSLTTEFYWDLRDFLNRVNNENISYCTRESSRNRSEGNNGMAYLYEQQRLYRLQLERIYNALLEEHWAMDD